MLSIFLSLSPPFIFSFVLSEILSNSDIWWLLLCKIFLLLFFSMFNDDCDAATADEIEVEKVVVIGFIEDDWTEGIFTLKGKCCTSRSLLP